MVLPSNRNFRKGAGLRQSTGQAWRGAGIILMMVLLMGIPVSGAGPDGQIRAGIPARDIVLVNHSALNGSSLEEFQKSPEPVSIIHAEVSETALPGPRYMAFGPATMDIAVSPVVLSALVVLVFAGIGGWLIWKGRPEDAPEKEE